MADTFHIDDIIKALLTDREKGFVDRLAEQFVKQKGNVNQIIDLTFHRDKQLGFRAGWLLDTLMINYPENYIQNLPYFIGRFYEVVNPSCQRHFARILMYFLDDKAPVEAKQILTELNLDDVVEKCFDWLINPKVKVAVKASATDILYHLSTRYDWIAPELEN